MVAKSKSVFSLLLQVNIPNNWDNLPHIQHYLSPKRKYPKYSQYSEPFPPNSSSCRIKAKPKYLELDTNITANFTNNTGYTFQLQASTQPTMLTLVLDHTPNAITTV